MFKYLFYFTLFIGALSCNTNSKKESAETEKSLANKPNILIFYVDDLGYADVGIYGAKGVKTPNVDRLAENGIKFTDAHSPAATCTPSRYSLLTGEYAFRNDAKILPGDAPLLIAPQKPTIASMLKRAGYKTAVVGKWHLGLGAGQVNWNKEVKPGPLEIGFDYSFLLPATADRVPTVYLENHNVANLDTTDPIEISYTKKVGNRPTGLERPDLLRYKADTQHSQTIINGVSRIGTIAGGESALWVDEEFPDIFLSKAKKFIHENKDKPFFLFFSLTDIHVPRLPNKRFEGKSTMGVRGDAIAQMDWTMGELIKELEKLGIDDNTFIIFTSDNGPVLDDGYADMAVEMLGEHNPSGIYRGGKYSSFEAGTRVPTITYWPGKIKVGESDAMFSQVDFYASISKLVNENLAKDEAVDSQDVIDALLGYTNSGTEFMLEEAFSMSIRKNKWKYIEAFSGDKVPEWLKNKDVETGLEFSPQLYDLSVDPSEKNNVADKYPEKVKELQTKLNEIKAGK
jgi:arylsulfatase A-like enzyme